MGRHGVGYDQIDVDAATARGIQVVYTPGANTQSVAEHVFALMIGLSRHFPRMIAELIAGNYHFRTSMTGREIAGKTLGIVGFGRIGRRVAEIAHLGFGMKVLYHDIVPAPERGRAAARTPAGPGLREVLEGSDYVTLHVPLDPSTRWHDQPRDPRDDASGRDPDQHLPRAGGRRDGGRRRPSTPTGSGATAPTSTRSSRRCPAIR